jgi:hypothetical protein
MVISSCSPLVNTEFNRNYQKWQTSDVTHYQYDLSVVCFCAFSQRMPLTIEIQDKKVISMVYNDGTILSDSEKEIFKQYRSIDAIFDFTQESMNKADEIHVEYDPDYGFPKSVQIDFVKNAVDDELGLIVQNFKPFQ